MCNGASRTWLVVLPRAAALLLLHYHLLCLPSSSEAADPPVKCDLTMERASFILGQPVRATIRITNQGNTPVLVLEPRLINKHAVVLTITRQDGSVAEYNGSRTGGYFPSVVSLPAGESVEEVVTISEYYDIAAPGEYKVRATCHLDGLPGSGKSRGPGINSDLEVFRIQQANGRFQRRLSIEPDPAAKLEWQVFTHKVGDVVRVYSRTFFERRIRDRVVVRKYWCFVDIGAIRSEETVSCTSDPNGTLHVLFQPLKEPEGLYAHAMISKFGKLEGVRLHRAAKGTRPSLVTGVYVEGAQRVQRGPKPE